MPQIRRSAQKAENRGDVVGVKAALAGLHPADLALRTIQRRSDVLAAQTSFLAQCPQFPGYPPLPNRDPLAPAHGHTFGSCHRGMEGLSPQWKVARPAGMAQPYGDAEDVEYQWSLCQVDADGHRGAAGRRSAGFRR